MLAYSGGPNGSVIVRWHIGSDLKLQGLNEVPPTELRRVLPACTASDVASLRTS